MLSLSIYCMREKTEEDEQGEETPPMLHFSSFPDDAIMPPPSTAADDFKDFQEFFCRIADSHRFH